jgi:hypothetical protein
MVDLFPALMVHPLEEGETMPRYGREDTEWDTLVETGLTFLIELAKRGDSGGNVRPSSYTELNTVLTRRTGFRAFDFDQKSERHAIGELLGDITARHRDRTGADFMISALVFYLGENNVGPGFYADAVGLGLLKPRATADAKDVFWLSQCKAIAKYYGSSSGEP